MSAQAALAIAALITAVGSLGLGVVGLIRSARAEEAKNKADLSQVGLEAVKVGMATQERALAEALGQVAELRAEVRLCKQERLEERQEAAAQLAGLAAQIEDLQRRLER